MTAEQGVAGIEKSLEELEALLKQMESGELSLEEALKHFERGIQLTRQCQEALKTAEQRVEILLQKTPDGEPEPFANPEA